MGPAGAAGAASAGVDSAAGAAGAAGSADAAGAAGAAGVGAGLVGAAAAGATGSGCVGAAGSAGASAAGAAGVGRGFGPGRGPPGFAPVFGLGAEAESLPAPLSCALVLTRPFSDAESDFSDGNDSRSRRATGASTVDDADLTNSPCSLSRASSSLLVTPSSFANSCTRALPATALLTERSSEAWCPHDLGLSPGDVHRRCFTVCSSVLLPVLVDGCSSFALARCATLRCCPFDEGSYLGCVHRSRHA